MPQSTLVTVKSFHDGVVADIPQYIQYGTLWIERFRRINLVQRITQGLLAPVVGKSYMTDTTSLVDATGRYYVSGASWATATSRLTATMDTSFDAVDVGKAIMFRIGTSVYVGQISAFISTTVVEVSGDSLPASDGTVNYVLVASTALNGGNTINIATYPVLWESRLRIEILSTATTKCYPAVSGVDFQQFDSNDPTKKLAIIWNLVGRLLYFKKGASISYGTITIRYPRLVTDRSADTDYMDLIDGAMMDIGRMVYKNSILKSLGAPIDNSGILQAVQQQHQNEGIEISKEESKAKIESLL